jgi:endogenous inhibitor of DNA gyrase (YacG/DUF329 family)
MAEAMTVDLNKWHHDIHQVTGGMALHFNRATAVDLRKWAAKLRTVADEMDVASLDAPKKAPVPKPRWVGVNDGGTDGRLKL